MSSSYNLMKCTKLNFHLIIYDLFLLSINLLIHRNVTIWMQSLKINVLAQSLWLVKFLYNCVCFQEQFPITYLSKIEHSDWINKLKDCYYTYISLFDQSDWTSWYNAGFVWWPITFQLLTSLSINSFQRMLYSLTKYQSLQTPLILLRSCAPKKENMWSLQSTYKNKSTSYIINYHTFPNQQYYNLLRYMWFNYKMFSKSTCPSELWFNRTDTWKEKIPHINMYGIQSLKKYSQAYTTIYWWNEMLIYLYIHFMYTRLIVVL